MEKNRIEKYVGRLFAVVCTSLLFLGVWNILRYIIVDDTRSYTRVMMHEYYNQDNIDVLFSGASLCYRSFDTRVLDERLGVNTFNAGSSSQDLDASYYLIKDAIDRYDLSHVFLELSPVMALNLDIEERDIGKLYGTHIISDYMKPSVSKVVYLLNASRSEYYVDSFLVARRNWEKLFDPPYVGALLKVKASHSYRSYCYDNLVYDTEYYVGKGYVASTARVMENAFYSTHGFEPLDITGIGEEWFQYLFKIIKYCQKKGVKITLICAPLSEYLLTGYEKYEDYHNLIEDIALDNNIEFWDFNFCKEVYFSGKASFYQDATHLNMHGATVLSDLISDLIKGKVMYEDVFYETFDEKFATLNSTIYGVAYEAENKKIIAKNSNLFEYQIYAVSSEGEEYLIQDFSSNIEFSVNVEEHGILIITARKVDNRSETIKVNISY